MAGDDFPANLRSSGRQGGSIRDAPPTLHSSSPTSKHAMLTDRVSFSLTVIRALTSCAGVRQAVDPFSSDEQADFLNNSPHLHPIHITHCTLASSQCWIRAHVMLFSVGKASVDAGMHREWHRHA